MGRSVCGEKSEKIFSFSNPNIIKGILREPHQWRARASCGSRASLWKPLLFTTQFRNLVPSSWMSRRYTPLSPLRLDGVQWDCFQLSYGQRRLTNHSDKPLLHNISTLSLYSVILTHGDSCRWDFRFSRRRVLRYLLGCYAVSLVDIFRRFRCAYCPHHRPDCADTKHLRNVGTFLTEYTAQHPWRRSHSWLIQIRDVSETPGRVPGKKSVLSLTSYIIAMATGKK
jgi:hypothetical protein